MSGKVAAPMRNGEVIMRVQDGLRQIRCVRRMCVDYVRWAETDSYMRGLYFARPHALRI